LESGLKTLLPEDRQNLALVPEGSGSSKTKYSQKQAEVVVIFNLNSLAEIANTKNNLIGVGFLINIVQKSRSKHFGIGSILICLPEWSDKVTIVLHCHVMDLVLFHHCRQTSQVLCKGYLQQAL
jgi:hypothetical protein